MRGRPAEFQVDLYAVLGVSRAATGAEIRRAYRRLALVHHPDRAGAPSAPRFAQIAEAYRMLSDPTARAAYDAHRLEREVWPGKPPDAGGGVDGNRWTVSSIAWSATMPQPISGLIARLTGPLEALTAAGAARLETDGVLELSLSATEAAAGGTAVVTMPMRISCPTCGGVASPRGVWCQRCEYAGHVTDAVAVQVAIPRAVPDGFSAHTIVTRAGAAVPRVRIRVNRR